MTTTVSNMAKVRNFTNDITEPLVALECLFDAFGHQVVFDAIGDRYSSKCFAVLIDDVVSIANEAPHGRHSYLDAALTLRDRVTSSHSRDEWSSVLGRYLDCLVGVDGHKFLDFVPKRRRRSDG